MEHYCNDCGYIEVNDEGTEFTCPKCESENVNHSSTERGEE